MGKKRILVVDDQEEHRSALKSILENEGYEVDTASNSEDALEIYSVRSFNLVLTDLNLPGGISGIELLRNIKSINDDAVVILITGISDIEKTQQAVKYGAADYILKPVQTPGFLRSIKKALSKESNLEEKKHHQEELERNVDEITETLKFQKEALEREQERTRGIIEAAHIGFLVLDAESEELFLINKRGKELLRIVETGDPGFFMRNYVEIFSEKISQILKKIINSVQKEKNVVDYGKYTLDETLVLHFAGYPLIVGGNLSSIVVVVEDITENQILEKQILQSSRLADIGELAAVVGHEINNPIAFIQSNMQSLSKYFRKIQEYMDSTSELESFLSELNIDERKILDIYQGVLSINGQIQKKKDEIRDLREKLKISATLKNINDIINENLEGLERVKKIVLDLKTLSYMGEEKLEEADINRVLQETLDMLWNQIKFKVEVIKRFGTLPALRCYSRQLSQVFTNIIMNAAQAMDRHGTITINTRYEAQSVVVEIADTGCGMDDATLKKLFTPFFTTKKIGKGTGLGLSISFKIIEKHKGKIIVKSEPNKGSIFTIILPLDGIREG